MVGNESSNLGKSVGKAAHDKCEQEIKDGSGSEVKGLTDCSKIESRMRLNTSSIIVEDTIDLPSFVWVKFSDSNVGIITAIDDDMKIIPINSEAVRENSNQNPSAIPAARGIRLFRAESQPISYLSSLKLSNLVSRPAINMRKISPIWLRNPRVGVTSATSSPYGPTTTPAVISASTQGKWKRRNAVANSTVARRMRKKGKNSIWSKYSSQRVANRYIEDWVWNVQIYVFLYSSRVHKKRMHVRLGFCVYCQNGKS